MRRAGSRGSHREDPVLREEDGLLRVVARTHEWLRRYAPGAPTRTVGRIRLMVMMCSDHRSGRYPHLPLATVWALFFALAYITFPIDLIPDVIPGLGWLDDAFVIALVWRACHRDLRRYCDRMGIPGKRYGL
jgi:uncharacterized membrane protein YkvA (DUF1232 family)